jgi:alpha-galactosidase
VYDRTYKGNLGKGQMCLEYSDQGTGDYRSPSFIVIDNFQGCAISPLRYKSHHIFRGKEKLPSHLPSLRLDERDATTLTITLHDKGSGLEVDLIYVALHNYDAISRRAVFRNIDNRDYEKIYGKVIERAYSSTIDLEASNKEYHIVKLCGSWARERYVVETKITHGMNSFASTRGVSGHQHNPFVAVTTGEPNECSGETVGFSLLYSGNHSFEVQMNEMGRVRVNCGINPEGFSWFLCPFSEFYTPEVIIARSSHGLGSLSRIFHRLFNYHLIPKITWAVSNPPVLLNTWETLYFDVNHRKILDMAQKAATMGIDLIVIDDGWFSERSDDTSSLGDWFENKRKFPNGLKAVADDVSKLGLKLGLWLEPECISMNSELFQNHPDWCLRLPARQVQVGRNQLVLDLSRSDVRQYLVQTIKDILDR